MNSQQVADYIRAELSVFTRGKLPMAEQGVRLHICQQNTCGCHVVEDGTRWCDCCGCGRRKRAKLTTKVAMPLARCPRNLWPAPRRATLPPPTQGGTRDARRAE